MLKSFRAAVARRYLNKEKSYDQTPILSLLLNWLRPRQPMTETDEPVSKKVKLNGEEEDKDGERPARFPGKKRKVALLCAYSGQGYYGVQVQTSGYPTIESELFIALIKAKVVPVDHTESPGKMKFQRTSRTDKGVSAATQVFSLNMVEDQENLVANINTHLPPQIRVFGYERTTKGFDCKRFCTGRAYEYLLPTFAFAPLEEVVTEEFRMSESIREEVNGVLRQFVGTKNYYNYTSAREYRDPSATRYLTKLEMGEPFIRGDLEFALIKVEGQSFMLHQIRKMIGMTIAITRGLANADSLRITWGPARVDVPMAPGLGLLLDKVFFTGYNNKFKSTHPSLDWKDHQAEIEKFKQDVIYKSIIETEKKENSMLTWLGTLHNHSFDFVNTDRNRPKKDRSCEDKPADGDESINTSDQTAQQGDSEVVQPESSLNQRSEGQLDSESNQHSEGQLHSESNQQPEGQLGSESNQHSEGQLHSESNQQSEGQLGSENNQHSGGQLDGESNQRSEGQLDSENKASENKDSKDADSVKVCS